MVFRVAARTVLELGAELISSDSIAIYELVKNAIDAESEDGVTIELCVVIRNSDYVDACAKIDSFLERPKAEQSNAELSAIKAYLLNFILPNSPAPQRQATIDSIESAQSGIALRKNLETAYLANNWIEFRDTGSGMSREDLLRVYLMIGTPSRRHSVSTAIKNGEHTAPYLGEKGVGRLSAMRLGTLLHVQTSTKKDKNYNILDINWSDFEDLDKLVEDISITPTTGEKKDTVSSGTIIKISGLSASWSAKRIKQLATFELAKLTDPFSKSKRRSRIAIIFNGERIAIPRLDQTILGIANARAYGSYKVENGIPSLEFTLWCGDLGKGNTPEERRMQFDRIDLISMANKNTEHEIATSALTTVGPFEFDMYWYNRQLMKKVLSIGDQHDVRALHKQWSGIMLFRDGYRVFPYGDDDDDWLGFDRKALASGGYKLNKAQFIGHVAISRTRNSYLIDQTNREGLKDCDQKTVLIEILYFVIQNRLRQFMKEVESKHQKVDRLDLVQSEKNVSSLETRALSSIRALEKRHAQEKPQLRELLTLFEEMRGYFTNAKKRAEQVEDERDRMIQLAGVGLMLEMVAHELARSSEYTLRMLDEANAKHLPQDIAALFGALRDEMKTMNKRLRTLDPLSVSGRQRKENFDFVALVREIFAGHASQFKRHHVEFKLDIIGKEKSVPISGVRGMYVQIIENLIQNSIYWMALRKSDERDYTPKIEVKIGQPPFLLEFTDNGPGIQPALRDEIFKAFFSTKGKSRRQGLGLYIARDCANYHGDQLYLSDERTIHKNRLNTFILEAPKASK